MSSVAESIDASRDGLCRLLQQLISFSTESQAAEATHFPAQVRACMAEVVLLLEGMGFEIETWDTGPSSTFDAHPTVVATRKGSGGGRSVAFNGHIDVVPSGDLAGWTHRPFGGEIAGGRLYGRGATDMKGGIAAALWAVKTALDDGFEPAGDIYFHIVSDEEVVGDGTREIAARAPGADVTISVEPSELALCAAEGGLVHFRIEVEGVEAHASTRYLSVHPGGAGGGGVNAIEKMVKLIVGLQELERQWANTKSHPILPPGYNTLLPAIIQGGPGGGKDGRLNLISNAGTTPNYCSLEYNLWFYPHETFEDVAAEVEAYIHALSQTDPWLQEHPPRISWKVKSIYFPPMDLALDHPAVVTASKALAAIGLDPAPRGFGAATDLAWYGERGLPGFICGPGRLSECHVVDEYLEVDELVRASKLYGLFVTEWCA
jgi:acetylornithine deacetylase/succinyl-diaminopimelate desuccinylase family protein